jgi:hypothetical protein
MLHPSALSSTLIPTVLAFYFDTVMPGARPGIHAVQRLRFRNEESAPFSARTTPLDGVDARTSAGHDGAHVDGSISRAVGISHAESNGQ